MKKKSITIKDVAKLANVSTMTVSRVISNPQAVKPNTLRQVQEAIMSLDYQVNISARVLSSKKSFTIGVSVARLHRFFACVFFVEIIRGIQECVIERNYNLLIFDVISTQTDDHVAYSMLTDGRCDGLVVIAPQIGDQEVLKLKRKGHHVVIVCGKCERKLIDYVDGDNAQAMRLAVKHFSNLGHRRIAFIGGDETMSNAVDRLEAFRQCIAEHGHDINNDYIVPGDFLKRSGYDSAKRLFELSIPPTAIISANDKMAIGAIKSLRDMGIKVPDDVAVMGIDDIEMSKYIHPSLTTVRQPGFEMGKRAAEILVDRIDAKLEGEPIECILPMKLIVRESCGSDPCQRMKSESDQL